MSFVRNYKADDYEKVVALYQDSVNFGGQFDEARDSREKLAEVIKKDPESILVYEEDGVILGTLSLIENGRVAWLFRFAVNEKYQNKIAQSLYNKAKEILTSRGHSQILVYSDPKNEALNERYAKLGMSEGSLFRCFWEEVEYC